MPDLATFAVDAGFSYAVPEPVRDRVAVGSLVRVPLGGRRVRGFVVALGTGTQAGLKELRGVSGAAPVFHPRLLETLRWAAHHYVAPLAVLLGKTAPPNLPVEVDDPQDGPLPGEATGPLARSADRALRRVPGPPTYLLGTDHPGAELAEAATPILGQGRSILVVCATAVEAAELAADLTGRLGARVVTVAGEASDREVTAAWSEAAGGGRLVVGTPRVALWPVGDLALACLLEEGRRAMKDRPTPTLHARDVLRTRAAVERFGLVMIGRVPSSETMASGVEVIRPPGRSRAWPLVEVVDRTEEPPGAGLLTQRVRTALRAVVASDERAFVFTHRHGYAPAYRCRRCRTLRVCSTCGSRAEEEGRCPRCGAEIGACRQCGGESFEPLGAGTERVLEELTMGLGAGTAGPVRSRRRLWVGTERDLPGLPPVALAVAVDADGLVLGTNYRAGEDALRTLARLAALVPSGRGRRLMVQTAQPSHPVLAALRRGDPIEYLAAEIERRRPYGFPPVGQILAVEVRDGTGDEDRLLRDIATGATVLGPAPVGRGRRWLIQGGDLGPVRTALRPAVQEMRDRGATVRIDADPLDL